MHDKLEWAEAYKYKADRSCVEGGMNKMEGDLHNIIIVGDNWTCDIVIKWEVQ